MSPQTSRRSTKKWRKKPAMPLALRTGTSYRKLSDHLWKKIVEHAIRVDADTHDFNALFSLSQVFSTLRHIVTQTPEFWTHIHLFQLPRTLANRVDDSAVDKVTTFIHRSGYELPLDVLIDEGLGGRSSESVAHAAWLLLNEIHRIRKLKMNVVSVEGGMREFWQLSVSAPTIEVFDFRAQLSISNARRGLSGGGEGFNLFSGNAPKMSILSLFNCPSIPQGLSRFTNLSTLELNSAECGGFRGAGTDIHTFISDLSLIPSLRRLTLVGSWPHTIPKASPNPATRSRSFPNLGSFHLESDLSICRILLEIMVLPNCSITVLAVRSCSDPAEFTSFLGAVSLVFARPEYTSIPRPSCVSVQELLGERIAVTVGFSEEDKDGMLKNSKSLVVTFAAWMELQVAWSVLPFRLVPVLEVRSCWFLFNFFTKTRTMAHTLHIYNTNQYSFHPVALEVWYKNSPAIKTVHIHDEAGGTSKVYKPKGLSTKLQRRR